MVRLRMIWNGDKWLNLKYIFKGEMLGLAGRLDIKEEKQKRGRGILDFVLGNFWVELSFASFLLWETKSSKLKKLLWIWSHSKSLRKLISHKNDQDKSIEVKYNIKLLLQKRE